MNSIPIMGKGMYRWLSREFTAVECKLCGEYLNLFDTKIYTVKQQLQIVRL